MHYLVVFGQLYVEIRKYLSICPLVVHHHFSNIIQCLNLYFNIYTEIKFCDLDTFLHEVFLLELRPLLVTPTPPITS